MIPLSFETILYAGAIGLVAIGAVGLVVNIRSPHRYPHIN